jgi:hypothetical protein
MAGALNSSSSGGAETSTTVDAGAPSSPAPAPVSFHEQIPADIRHEAYFRDIKSAGDLATRAYHQAKLIGRDPSTLAVIPEERDTEGWSKLYAQLGRPETSDKYAMPAGDYSEADKPVLDKLLPVLHAAGVSQHQLDTIVPAWCQLAARARSAIEGARAQAFANADNFLRAQWGDNFDQNIQRGDQAIEHYARMLELDGLAAAMKAAPPRSRVALAMLFAELGAHLTDDGVIGQTTGRDEALAAIAAKRGDQSFMRAYLTKGDPRHDDAVSEMARLHAAAYPEAGR